MTQVISTGWRHDCAGSYRELETRSILLDISPQEAASVSLIRQQAILYNAMRCDAMQCEVMRFALSSALTCFAPLVLLEQCDAI